MRLFLEIWEGRGWMIERIGKRREGEEEARLWRAEFGDQGVCAGADLCNERAVSLADMEGCLPRKRHGQYKFGKPLLPSRLQHLLIIISLVSWSWAFQILSH
jgi:hypothetical protein